MKEHVLKTLPDYWDAVELGLKNFEVRRDDRGFQKGDVLVLQKLDRDTFGRPSIHVEYRNGKPVEIRRKVVWVLTGGQFGIEPGHVVMALSEDNV
jgi:hypothetical protein